MGTHQKEPGLGAIALLKTLGQVLGYYPTTEEPMFPGDPNSPDLDVTWRRTEHARFPLFIFEVESLSAKASSDNAVKVFARRTPAFEKPLFFFHIFLDDSIGPGRVDYLSEHFDKLNYATYRLNTSTDGLRLIRDILEQHVRLTPCFDLYSVIDVLELQSAVKVSVVEVLNLLLEGGYDRTPGTDFLMTLELLIANRHPAPVRDYYLNYLNRYLSDDSRSSQNYSYAVSRSYSRVIHYAVALLLGSGLTQEDAFQQLRAIEEGFQPWKLWEPYFGLSRDHDLVLLSEFPLVLTLLCAAFSPSTLATYFSQKLAGIMREIRNFTHFNIHGLVWLLIASRIAGDHESYESARSIINANGGVPSGILVVPSVFVADEPDARLTNPTDIVQIVGFNEWGHWLKSHRTGCWEGDLLISVLDGFLIMNDPEESRNAFASYCLDRSTPQV
ncbi:MAG: hypothetical protein NTW68_00400 [candidate division NC10 bacterium]|nr:hypothetical protein [candidate division NC10 bacterium]